jgi:hypothetical protein
MKGITTLAALPSGAGQAAALPAEVGEAKPAPIYGSGGGIVFVKYPYQDLGAPISDPKDFGLKRIWSGGEVVWEAVDPLTGEKGGRNRKQIEFRFRDWKGGK